MSVLGAAISAGTSLLGGALSGIFGSKQDKKNRQFQKEMLLQQQAYNDTVIERQMAYQDKVNAQNFAWNDESNVRKRLEAAGYNPYLAKAGATGSASGASFGTGSSSLPSALPNPMEGFASSIGRAVSDFFQTKMLNEQIKQQQIQNDLGQIQLDTQNYKTPDGRPAWQLDVSRKVADTKLAQSQANIAAIDAWRNETLKAFQELGARDENGQPIVDEEGKPVSNFNADQQAKLNEVLTRVSNQIKDLQVKGANIKNIDVDTLLKKSNIDLNDEQKQVMRAQTNELLSRINSNYAQAAASLSAASLNAANAATINAIRPYSVSQSSWDAMASKYNAYDKSLNFDKNKFDWDKDDVYRTQRTWYPWRYVFGTARTGSELIGNVIGNAIPFFKK